VKEYEQAGVPADKIVLGVPFYGHEWGQAPAQDHGLFQPGKAVPKAFANYANISSTMLKPDSGFVRYWDTDSAVPYLYNAASQIFVSYDDPKSMALKCQYALDHHLAGIMFWDYSGDPSGALLDTVDAALLHPTTSGTQAQ
jgi:chitinase